jgi:hypothetical protein
MSDTRKPISEKQLAANRANATKSTGPTSASGKARSSQNALKHGLTAAGRFLIVRVEDVHEFERLRTDLIHDYQPVNSQELYALDRIARAQWKMLRAAQLESSLFTVGINKALADPRCRLDDELTEGLEVTSDQNRGFFMAEGWHRLAAESNDLALMLRYQAQAEREYRRAIEEFERLKKLRNELPNEPILNWGFAFNKMQWHQWHRGYRSHRSLLVLYNLYTPEAGA